MAEYLSKPLIALVLAWLALQPALAEVLPDPTRPPAEAGVVGEVVVPGGPLLQSVKIMPDGRAAVISGQLLHEGESFGEARVVRIGENEVVLDGPEGEQTLSLFPAVEKRPLRPAETQGKPANRKSQPKMEQKAP